MLGSWTGSSAFLIVVAELLSGCRRKLHQGYTQNFAQIFQVPSTDVDLLSVLSKFLHSIRQFPHTQTQLAGNTKPLHVLNLTTFHFGSLQSRRYFCFSSRNSCIEWWRLFYRRQMFNLELLLQCLRHSTPGYVGHISILLHDCFQVHHKYEISSV